MNLKPYKITLISISIILFIGLNLLIIKVVPTGFVIDWRLTYRPAALALLHGQNPYRSANLH
jgi:hypothetical protein